MALNVNKMSIAELNQLISDAQTALAKKQAVAEKVRKLAHDNGLDISDLMAADKPNKSQSEKAQRQSCPKIQKSLQTVPKLGQVADANPAGSADALSGGNSLDDLLI